MQWGPNGSLTHAKIGSWGADAHTHIPAGTIARLVADYGDLTPPGLLLGQLKLQDIEDAGSAAAGTEDVFTVTGTLIDGTAYTFDVTLEPGDSDEQFLGGPPLEIEAAESPYPGLHWYKDVPTVIRKLDGNGDPIPGSGAAVSFDLVWDEPYTVSFNGVYVSNQHRTLQAIKLGPPARRVCLVEGRYGIVYRAYVRDAGGIATQRLYGTQAEAWDDEAVAVEDPGADWPWITRTRDDLLVLAYHEGMNTRVAYSKRGGKGRWEQADAVIPWCQGPVICDDWSGRLWIMGLEGTLPVVVRSSDLFATLDRWPDGNTKAGPAATSNAASVTFLRWEQSGRMLWAGVETEAGIEVWQSGDGGYTWKHTQTVVTPSGLTRIVALEYGARMWLFGYDGTGGQRVVKSLDDWASFRAMGGATEVAVADSSDDRLGAVAMETQGRPLLVCVNEHGVLKTVWSKDGGPTWEELLSE